MAKTISDEKIKLSIIIDGNPAQQELLKLEKATGDLNKRQRELSEEKRKLIREGKIESDQYKAVTAEIKQNTAAITANKARMSELQKEIGLTGLTMAQLQQKATALRAALRNAVPGGEAYQKYNNELTQVNGRLDELKGKGQAAGSSIGQLADKFNRYAGLAASAVAVGTGVVLSLQKMIDYNGKLADAQTNVQKTTGMTKTEVDELTKSFGMFQTRTSRIDLLGIAETGGRLGIAKEDIGDFVKVMDKAAVALGDSFEGGPEMVADKLGKIKGLFKETKDIGVESAFESIGSALNDLGAAGTASEANVAEFMTRIGAMPEAFKPSINEALGMGAAFEESGIRAEVAASNYSKVIGIASNSIGAFAQVMKRPKDELEKLINTNPNEFFLQFSQSLKGLDATQLAKVLDSLKLNDNEVKMVLGAASQNVDLFRNKIQLAGDSLGEATSLTDEFNVKNNNLAATLEKLQKKIVGAFSSETIVNGLASAAEWFARLVGATEDTDGSMQVWRNTLAFVAKIIAVVTAALISNAGAQKLVAMWTARNTEGMILFNLQQRAAAILAGIQTAGTYALAGAQALLSGNITKAKEAFNAMALAMKTTPWGLIIGMIGAAVTAYVVFSEKAEKLSKVQKVLADINLEAAKSIAKEKTELELLSKIAKDETISKEKRQKAIERLNQIIPDYIGNLSLENIKTAEGITILKKYTDELYKNARAKAALSKYNQLVEQRLDVESKTSKDYRGTSDKVSDSVFGALGVKTNYFKDKKDIEQYVLKNFGDYVGKRTDKTTGVTMVDPTKFKEMVEKLYAASGLGNKDAELADLDAQIKAVEALALQGSMSLEKTGSSGEVIQADPNAVSDGKGGKSGKKEKYDDSYLDKEKKMSDELYQVWKKSQEDKIALMQNGYDKEIALENLKHQDIVRQNFIANEEIIAMQKDLDKQMEDAIKTGDTKKISSIKNMQGLLVDKQKELSNQLEFENQMHFLRVGTLQEKAEKDAIEKLKDQYDQEAAVRETAFLNELETLNLTDEEKKKRREEFDKKELGYVEKNLQDQLAVLKQALSGNSFNGVAFDLLTPEQKEKMQADLELVLLAIAKLKAAKNGTPEEGTKEIDLGMGEKTDILGFSQTQWDNFFKNIEQGTIGFQTMSMAVQAAQQLFAQFDQYQTASENAQLKKYEKNTDAKKKRLKQQLDAGYINQTQYKKGIEAIDQELDKKKAEIEYKQAKRQRLMSIANVMTSTAQAIMSIWAQVPKFDFGVSAGILTGIVAATGALQLGTILKTPLPAKGFEEGLYRQDVMREQDGKVFRADYGGKTRSGVVNKPTYFLTGENGPEMIIDSKAYSQLSPETRNALLREIRGIKGFENGYYKGDTLNTGSTGTNQPSNNTPTSDSEIMRMMLNVVAENTAVMKDLRDNPILAMVSSKDMKSMKELKEGLKKYEAIINKSKQS